MKSFCTLFMATSKKRINISLPPEVEIAITLLAKRDKVPQSTKAVQLIQEALELEEDKVLEQIVIERDTPDAKFISHEEMWS